MKSLAELQAIKEKMKNKIVQGNRFADRLCWLLPA